MASINSAPRGPSLIPPDELDAVRDPERCDRIAAEADRIIARQANDIAKMKAAANALITAIRPLEFPLGCPVRGYDKDDLMETARDILGCPDAVDENAAIELIEAEEV